MYEFLQGETSTLKVGQKAPIFSLNNQNGEKISLKTLIESGPTILYFYPKDLTPGCTREAGDFNNLLGKIRKLNSNLVGISADPQCSHEKFCTKLGLEFSLLSDIDHKVAEKYGVWQEKSLYGRKFMGILRSTFIIGQNGKILACWPKVKVAGHAEEVLQALKVVAVH
ncbi:MAG: thioredoxin-dependent thiol peroxidase [Oligoflexales bacterium]|nr:thioredoxin-dependent thiol peroxidase [Oligoflexales bacterium]